VLWVGMLTAVITFGVLMLVLALARRLDRSEYPIVGDGSLLGRDDVQQEIHASHQ
jgi:hypothetical protein